MRIVFITHKLIGGGAERMVAMFSNVLVDRGEEVYILSARLDKDDYAVGENVHIYLWNNKVTVNSFHRIPKVRDIYNIMASFLQIVLQIRVCCPE